MRHGWRSLQRQALGPLVNLVEGAGQALRVPGDFGLRGVGGELARTRDRHLDQQRRHAAEDRHEKHDEAALMGGPELIVFRFLLLDSQTLQTLQRTLQTCLDKLLCRLEPYPKD